MEPFKSDFVVGSSNLSASVSIAATPVVRSGSSASMASSTNPSNEEVGLDSSTISLKPLMAVTHQQVTRSMIIDEGKYVCAKTPLALETAIVPTFIRTNDFILIPIGVPSYLLSCTRMTKT